mmetsp:Transcript_31880/g.77695  ORF Transcript_31880/g.77695 Transcript_31880/m.77695 type:complete len:93 (-) Transcript_31880:1000-1278(-)
MYRIQHTFPGRQKIKKSFSDPPPSIPSCARSFIFHDVGAERQPLTPTQAQGYFFLETAPEALFTKSITCVEWILNVVLETSMSDILPGPKLF